jgi:hypothetical protein
MGDPQVSVFHSDHMNLWNFNECTPYRYRYIAKLDNGERIYDYSTPISYIKETNEFQVFTEDPGDIKVYEITI